MANRHDTAAFIFCAALFSTVSEKICSPIQAGRSKCDINDARTFQQSSIRLRSSGNFRATRTFAVKTASFDIFPCGFPRFNHDGVRTAERRHRRYQLCGDKAAKLNLGNIGQFRAQSASSYAADRSKFIDAP